MKVLQVNTIAGSGSTGRIVFDILNIIHGHGNDGMIACAIDDSSKKYKEYVYRVGGRINPRYIHAIAARITDRSGFYSKRATKRLIKFMDGQKFDIIHLHNIHGYYINLPILFKYLRENKMTVIWTLHDCWAFTGHCTYFDFCGCDKWREQCRQCPQKGKYPKSILLDNSSKNYIEKNLLYGKDLNMTIVTPSKWLADICKQSFLSGYDIRVIRNGIDLNKFYRREAANFRKSYGLDGKFVILAVCAGWSMNDIKNNRKGMGDILKLSEMISGDYKIVMVGFEGDEAQKGLPSKIIGINKTKSIDNLAMWYSAANVFINPTYEDNFPTTNLEALACGTPVITYNTGGSPESVSGNIGVIVEKGDIYGMYKAIKDYKERRKCSQECIAYAQRFDRRLAFEQYYDLYIEKVEID